MWRESASFSQITFQTRVGKVVSYPDIDVDIPAMQRENVRPNNYTGNAYLETPHWQM
jgi:hypothetical protein